MSCFSSFFAVVAWGNLLLQYVNSMNCTFKLGWGVNGSLYEGVVPCMQSIPGCSLARHLHLGRDHVHGGAMMVLYSSIYGFWALPMFMSVKLFR